MGETNKIIGVHRAPSTYIFHGPGAFEAAVSHAESWGRQLCPPLGGSGVRKDDSRTFAALHRNPPVSDQAGCVIIGPMDAATDEASDALLKMVEEPNPDAMPILWAADLGGVRPTIRSRCHAEWCPGAVDIAEPPASCRRIPQSWRRQSSGATPLTWPPASQPTSHMPPHQIPTPSLRIPAGQMPGPGFGHASAVNPRRP